GARDRVWASATDRRRAGERSRIYQQLLDRALPAGRTPPRRAARAAGAREVAGHADGVRAGFHSFSAGALADERERPKLAAHHAVRVRREVSLRPGGLEPRSASD